MLDLGGTGTESAFLFLTRFVRNFAGVSAGEREKPNFYRYICISKSSKHLQNSDVDDDDETMVMLSSDHNDDDGDDDDDDVAGALPC